MLKCSCGCDRSDMPLLFIRASTSLYTSLADSQNLFPACRQCCQKKGNAVQGLLPLVRNHGKHFAHGGQFRLLDEERLLPEIFGGFFGGLCFHPLKKFFCAINAGWQAKKFQKWNCHIWDIFHCLLYPAEWNSHRVL